MDLCLSCGSREIIKSSKERIESLFQLSPACIVAGSKSGRGGLRQSGIHSLANFVLIPVEELVHC
jgi:hypothetical protein